MRAHALFQEEIILKQQNYIEDIFKRKIMEKNWANQTWQKQSLDKGNSMVFFKKKSFFHGVITNGEKNGEM